MYTLHALGPLRLMRDGVPVLLSMKKTQALVLVLACRGWVPRELLVSWLWPKLSESDGRRNLRRELARLRDSGTDGLVQTQLDLLALADDTVVDTLRFAAELKAGRPQAALALWRGILADGLRLDDAGLFEDWLEQERQRWRGQRVQALTQSAQALEAQGQMEAALQSVQALLDDDPLQEQQHRHAMRLLAALGRREAALAQYERCAQLLAEELGLAPMDSTRALAGQLQGHAETTALPLKPAPAQPATVGMQVPRLLPFVGRETDVQALERAWTLALPMLVEGVGGIGKTRLACDFAAAHGPYALVGVRAGDAELPYSVITRALRVLAGGDDSFDGLPPWVGAELARLMPELGPAGAPLTTAEERARLVEACVQAWRALADGNFDAVIVDDWHLADATSQAVLTQVALRGAKAADAARLMLLWRPELHEAGRQQLQALHAGCAAEHRVLEPLAPDTVRALVRQMSGASAPERFAARLQRATGGNPFFIGEVLRHGVGSGWLQRGENGQWQTPYDEATQDYRELPLPDSVRDAVLARAAQLPEATRRMLDAATLATEPWQPPWLAAACALTEIEASGAIELGLQAQMFREHERGGYAFAHDLVQQALVSTLSPVRRRLLHRRLALGAEAGQAAPAQIARHWEAAGEPGRAVSYRIQAAEAALRLLTEAEALAQWQAAFDDGPTPTQRLRVHTQRWAVLRSRGDKPGLQATVVDLDALALALARDDGDPGAAADAACTAASVCALTDRSAEALVRIDAVLSTLGAGDAVRRARAMEARSIALLHSGQLEAGQAAAESAMALQGLPPEQTARLLDMLAYRNFLAGQPAQAVPFAERALALWQALHVTRWVARARTMLGTLLGMQGDLDRALAELDAARELAAASGLPEQQREATLNLVNFALHRGQARRVLALLAELESLPQAYTRRHRQMGLMLVRHAAHAHLGELGTALTLADEAERFLLADDEPGLLADAVSMLLGLHSMLRDDDRVQSLLALLGSAPTREMGYYAIKLAFARAGHELARGDCAAARHHLQAVGEQAALEQPEDRGLWALRSAQLALAEGDPLRALALTDEWAETAPTVELLASLQATRLQAARIAGVLRAEHLATAQAALAGNQLPAIESWRLQAECACAARALHAPAAAHEAEAAALHARLADSLAGHPAQQARWRDAAGSALTSLC